MFCVGSGYSEGPHSQAAQGAGGKEQKGEWGREAVAGRVWPWQVVVQGG